MRKRFFGFESARRPTNADGQIPLSFDSKQAALRYLAERIERDAVESALFERGPAALAQHVKARMR